MSEEFDPLEEYESFRPEVVKALVVDHFADVRRAASIVGDLRKALREEGFTREETFELIKSYWDSEMGLI